MNENENDEIIKAEGKGPTKVGKTWFIKRGDGFIFACGEAEAWGLFHNRNEWMRNDFKIIGVSDGKTYVKKIHDASHLKGDLEAKIQKISQEVTRYLKTQDKLKYEDLLEDDDPKLVKLKGILDPLQEELDKLNADLNNIQRKIIQDAFDAELAVAKGHIEYPKNQDVFTPGGNRDKILKNIG